MYRTEQITFNPTDYFLDFSLKKIANYCQILFMTGNREK